MNNTCKSLCLGLLVCKRDVHLLRRSLLLAERVYEEYLRTIIIIKKESVELPLEGLTSKIIIVDYLNNTVPQFFNMQRIYWAFLNSTHDDYLITIDPDTVVLDWDGLGYSLAGQFIHYKKARIQERLRTMPAKVKHHFRKVMNTGCVHSIQGGWSMRSREICKRMAEHFFLDDSGEWEENQWKSHELYFGLYLKMAGIRHLRDYKYVRSFLDKRARYLTEGNRDRVRKRLRRAYAFHPVKTQKDFDWLMESLIPDHREQIEQWLKERL